MKKILGIFWKIACWYLVLMFVIMMFVGGASTVLFGLAALLVAPVGKLKDFKRKLRITPKLTVVLTIVLLFAGVLLAPILESESVIDSELETELLEKKQTEEFEEKISVIDEQEVDVIDKEQKVEEAEIVIPENSTFSIRFLDMGQADATLIECDGHHMLIDGGNRDSSSKMYAILEDAEIEHLDIVVGTHPDEDHIGGLAGALNYASADMVLCSTTVHDTEPFNDFAKYAEQNGGGIIVPEIGDAYLLGSSKITILGVNGGIESNDTSIILKIEYGETTFLFTGDAEGVAEQAVLDSGVDISSTVLKVGHHGSADSTTEAFLNQVMPAYAIISVGTENTYLHPTDDTLNRLKNVNAEVYRTDLQGEITLVSDSKTVSITTEKEASKEALMISGEEAAAIAEAQLEAEEKAKVEEKAKTEAEAQARAEAEEKEEQVLTPTDTKNNDGSAGVIAPTGTDYVLNTNTRKFHYPSCGSVKKMKAKNTAYYNGTRDEVIAKGYDPCGNCHP